MRAMRVDGNQADIIEAAEKMGCSVEVIRSTSRGLPDLLVGYRGVNFLWEVKAPKTGRLSEGQKEWHERWKGLKPVILKSVDDVVKFLTRED